jgi:hypothetical protein
VEEKLGSKAGKVRYGATFTKILWQFTNHRLLEAITIHSKTLELLHLVGMGWLMDTPVIIVNAIQWKP